MNALTFNRSQAVFGSGPRSDELAHSGLPLTEQRDLARSRAVADLSSVGVVRITGQDRLSWLNSLTTQKLDQLAPGESTETLVLSPHGHIEHWMRIVADDESLWLLIDDDPSPAAEFLSSMVFMMEVGITDLSAHYQVVGGIGPAPAGLPVHREWDDPWPRIGEGSASYARADTTEGAESHPGAALDFRLFICPVEQLRDWDPQTADVRVVGRDAFDALRIEAWRPAAQDADHRALVGELDILRTAVHLAKGCYRGQEAVARVHNLGQVPRRFVFLHLDGSGHSLPRPGDEIRAQVRGAVRPVGHVTSAQLHYELGPIALGVVKRTVPADEELTVAVSTGSEAETEEVTASQEVIVDLRREHLSPRPVLNREIDHRSR